MNMHEIDDEIYKLENGDTTWRNCEKLAILYNVKNGLSMTEKEKALPMENISAYSYKNNDSEFIELFKRANIEDALKILDEHMEIIKAIYPKEYRMIMRKIESTL